MTNHPTHPATVHFPLTFTCLAGALDTIYFASITPATSGLVASAFKTLDLQVPLSLLPTLSYYATLLTIVTAIPAVLTGAYELSPVIKRDGFSSKKAQVGVLHALVNDLQVFGAVYNWYTRRDVKAFVPSGLNVGISAALAVPASLFAAYLGGQLVYQYGMGVGRGRGGGGKKTQ